LFRQGIRDRFRHREHRFHPLCVCLLDYNIRVRATLNYLPWSALSGASYVKRPTLIQYR
jgi:hypothetical protein